MPGFSTLTRGWDHTAWGALPFSNRLGRKRPNRLSVPGARADRCVIVRAKPTSSRPKTRNREGGSVVLLRRGRKEKTCHE